MQGKTIEQLRAHYAAKGKLDRAERNLQVVRDAYVALDSGDVETFFSAWAPDCVLYEAEGMPYGGVYRGIEECRRCVTGIFQYWEKVDYEVKELMAGGDLVFIVMEIEFKLKGQSPPFTMPVSEVWRFRDGKVIEMRPYYFDTHYIRQALNQNA